MWHLRDTDKELDFGDSIPSLLLIDFIPLLWGNILPTNCMEKILYTIQFLIEKWMKIGFITTQAFCNVFWIIVVQILMLWKRTFPHCTEEMKFPYTAAKRCWNLSYFYQMAVVVVCGRTRIKKEWNLWFRPFKPILFWN